MKYNYEIVTVVKI